MPPRKVVNVQSNPKSKKRNKPNNGTLECRDEEEVPDASDSSISLSPASISNEKYGGPQNMSLLITYEDHIASRIWSGEKTSRLLSVPNHARTHNEWKIESCDFLKDLLRRTGLVHIAENAHLKYDDVLCSGFNERFYPETNTFHLPFGEMTITLDDISNITGLKINGSAVQAKGPRELGFLEASSLVSKYLNIDEDKVKEEFASNNKQTLSLSWLKNGWMHIDDSDSNQDKEAASRAYILHLIGSVLCPDKTKNAIGAYWIQSLKDITNFESVSLGSAILSYLFHQLGSASRHGTSSLSGCITLLQVWIYEHFPSLGRKIANENYEESLPRVCKWIPQVPQPSSVVTIRELLDDLAPQDVLWTPYENRIMYAPLENVIWYTGTMVCFDVAEPIYPERVLRQFGRVQRKPQRPLQTETTRRGDKASTYRVEYSKSIWHWEQWRNALLSEELRSIPVDNDIPWASDDGYMEWFNTVSHPIVQNPTRRLHQSLSQRLNPSQPATGKFAQRIKQIIEIALCRNIDADVAWKLQNYHRDEPLAEFGEINESPSQAVDNQGESSRHDDENEDIEHRRVRRSTRPPKPVERHASRVYKRKKNTN